MDTIIIKVDNSYSYFSSNINKLHNAILELLRKKTSYYINVYGHQPIRKHTFLRYDENWYKLPTGLLKPILKIFDKFKVNYKIENLIKDDINPINLLYFIRLLKKYDITLWEHQKNAIKKALLYKRGIINHATASGKTLTMAGIIYCLNVKTLYLIHMKGIAEQASEEFEKYTEIKVGLFAEGYINLNEQITVATVQSLNAFKKKDSKKYYNFIRSIKLIVVDECFNYNTLINTNIGKLKIGNIVENNLKVKVLSYNHSKCKFEYKNIKNYFKIKMKNKKKEMYEIKIKGIDGKIYKIKCTDKQPIYSIRDKYSAKYRNVTDLKIGDSVNIVNKEKIYCECGCGTLIDKYVEKKFIKKFAKNHSLIKFNKSEKNLNRMKNNNPMKNKNVREKARIKILQRIKEGKIIPYGHTSERGGNGCKMTFAEEKFKKENLNFKYNYVVKINKTLKEKYNTPYCYKVDFVNIKNKLAIEIDGESHKIKNRILQDIKKEKVLKLLGWKIIRFTNKEIMDGNYAIN